MVKEVLQLKQISHTWREEGGTLISVPTKLPWNNCVPLKVGFFVWEA